MICSKCKKEVFNEENAIFKNGEALGPICAAKNGVFNEISDFHQITPDNTEVNRIIKEASSVFGNIIEEGETLGLTENEVSKFIRLSKKEKEEWMKKDSKFVKFNEKRLEALNRKRKHLEDNYDTDYFVLRETYRNGGTYEEIKEGKKALDLFDLKVHPKILEWIDSENTPFVEEPKLRRQGEYLSDKPNTDLTTDQARAAGVKAFCNLFLDPSHHPDFIKEMDNLGIYLSATVRPSERKSASFIIESHDKARIPGRAIQIDVDNKTMKRIMGSQGSIKLLDTDKNGNKVRVHLNLAEDHKLILPIDNRLYERAKGNVTKQDATLLYACYEWLFKENINEMTNFKETPWCFPEK